MNDQRSSPPPPDSNPNTATTVDGARPSTGRAVLAAALPSYFIPATSAYLNALLIDRPELAAAAWTTIGGASAVAAVGAVLAARRRPLHRVPAMGRAVSKSALVGASVGAVVSAWLVGNGMTDAMVFTQIPLSAAIGAGLTTRRTLRGGRRRRPSQAERPAGVPAFASLRSQGEPA